jgi:hypothetical protein
MVPQLYKITVATGTSSIVVNGNSDNLDYMYGIIINQETSGNDTLIYLTSLYFKKDLVNL